MARRAEEWASITLSLGFTVLVALILSAEPPQLLERFAANAAQLPEPPIEQEKAPPLTGPMTDPVKLPPPPKTLEVSETSSSDTAQRPPTPPEPARQPPESETPEEDTAPADAPSTEPVRTIKALKPSSAKPPAPEQLVTKIQPLKPAPRQRPDSEAPDIVTEIEKQKPASRPNPDTAPPTPDLTEETEEAAEIADLPVPHDSAPAAKNADPDRDQLAEGRVLLRHLEHGSGPNIELAWPASAAARSQLFDHLERCFGLRVAILDHRGRLFTEGSDPGTPWQLNLDQFSGFIRSPSGQMVPQETAAITRIQTHHGPLPGKVVRLFPRSVDAYLLAGLRQIVGDAYGQSKLIRARYRLVGSRLYLDQVESDGSRLGGNLDLTPAGTRRCAGIAL